MAGHINDLGYTGQQLCLWPYQGAIENDVLVTAEENVVGFPDPEKYVLSAIDSRIPNYDTSARGDLTTFVDGGETSDWAVESTRWAVGCGILQGRGNGRLDPTGTATRAEAAKMVAWFCHLVKTGV